MGRGFYDLSRSIIKIGRIRYYSFIILLQINLYNQVYSSVFLTRRQTIKNSLFNKQRYKGYNCLLISSTHGSNYCYNFFKKYMINKWSNNYYSSAWTLFIGYIFMC